MMPKIFKRPVVDRSPDLHPCHAAIVKIRPHMHVATGPDVSSSNDGWAKISQLNSSPHHSPNLGVNGRGSCQGYLRGGAGVLKDYTLVLF